MNNSNIRFNKQKNPNPILNIGDQVDIIAPGFSCKSNEFKNAIILLKSWGLTPNYPSDIFKKNFLFSNNDQNRSNHFKQAFYNPTSKVIWCLRGGYGSLRILSYINKLKKPKKTKILIGLSDITLLHLFILQKWQYPVIHGPLLDRLGSGPTTKNVKKEMKDILFKSQDKIIFNNLKPLNKAALKTKKITGKITGGNLSVIQSTIGSSFQIHTKNKILFLEDIGERGYRIDRMLQHLKISGILKNLRAIIFGDFIGGKEANGKSLVFSVLKNFALETNIPIFAGLKSGHGKIQRPLPLGTDSYLIKENKNFNLYVNIPKINYKE